MPLSPLLGIRFCMGLIDSTQVIDYRRLPRGMVVLVSVVGGMVLGFIFSGIILALNGWINSEGTTQSRAIMYWFYKLGFHPSEPVFWSCIAFLDIGFPIFLIGITSLPTMYALQRILSRLTIPCIVRRSGYCQSCGYNLRDNVSGVCPECGTPVVEEPEDKPAGAFATIVFLFILLLFFIVFSILMLLPSLAR